MARSPIIKATLGEGSNQLDISDRITSLTYKRKLEHDDVVDIDIEGSDAEWLIEQPCCYPGSPFTFSYGYIGGGMSSSVTMALGDIEPEYRGRGGCTLSLSSIDASKAMKSLHSNKVWKKMRQDQIVEALAEIHGLVAEVQVFMSDPESQKINLDASTNRSSDSTTNAELMTTLDQTNPTRLNQYKNILGYSINSNKPVPFATYESFPQGWVSNHHLLQEMVSMMNLGYVSYVKNRILYFVQRNNGMPPLRIVKRGVDDVTRFKIKYREIHTKGSEHHVDDLTFDPKSVETFIKLGDYHIIDSSGVISRTNPGDGSRQVLNRITVNNTDAQGDDIVYKDEAWITVSNALKALNDTTISPDDIIKYVQGQQTNASVRQAIEEKYAIAQQGILAKTDTMLTATLTEMGRLDMDINIVIGIEGYNTKYDGNWFVSEVVDTVNKSGFYTTSELIKDATKKGIIPTDAANNSTEASGKKRSVSAENGGAWDYQSGFNVNNPQVNPQQVQKTEPNKKSDKATITTR